MVTQNNSSGLKESRQKVNTLPTINDRNTQLKSFETVFQNWIISQSFPGCELRTFLIINFIQ